MWSSSALPALLQFKYIFKYQKYLLGKCTVQWETGQHRDLPAAGSCSLLFWGFLLWASEGSWQHRRFFDLACWPSLRLGGTPAWWVLTAVTPQQKKNDNKTDIVYYTHPCSEFWVGDDDTVLSSEKTHFKRMINTVYVSSYFNIWLEMLPQSLPVMKHDFSWWWNRQLDSSLVYSLHCWTNSLLSYQN